MSDLSIKSGNKRKDICGPSNDTTVSYEQSNPDGTMNLKSDKELDVNTYLPPPPLRRGVADMPMFILTHGVAALLEATHANGDTEETDALRLIEFLKDPNMAAANAIYEKHKSNSI